MIKRSVTKYFGELSSQFLNFPKFDKMSNQNSNSPVFKTGKVSDKVNSPVSKTGKLIVKVTLQFSRLES